MKTVYFVVLFNLVLFSYSSGQSIDSTKVSKIYYNHNPNQGKTVVVTASQFEAKNDYDTGYSYVEKNEFGLAINPLLRAIEIDTTGNCGTGKDGMGFSELGYAYMRTGNVNLAIKYLEKAIQINKNVPAAYLSKSVILMQQGKMDLAKETLDLLIVYNPDYAMGYVQRGFLLNSTKKYELALNDLHKYLEITEEQNQVNNSIALVNSVRKKNTEIEKKLGN